MNNKFQYSDKFFGQSGYTSTSANFIANKAKEIIKGFSTDKISFITTTLMSLNSKVDAVYEKGLTGEEFDKLIERKLLEGKLNALVAWFREAIRAKDLMFSIAEHKNFESWMNENYPDVDLKTFDAELLPYPEMTIEETDESSWIRDNMSVKEINEYLYLEQMCAALGKFIHPNGEFANARKQALEKAGTTSVRDFQSNTLMYIHKASITAEDVEKKFFELQELYRDYQKRFHAIKFNIDAAVQKQNDEFSMQEKQFEEVAEQNKALIRAAKAKYMTEFNKWQIEKLDEIRRLKIVVPNDLKDTVQYINNVQND